MKYAIVIFPRFKGLAKVEEIREKYDPDFLKFRTHMTVAYPFESEISESELDQHIRECLKEFKPFKIGFKGIKESHKKSCIHLLVDQGVDKLVELYDKLHSKYIPKKKKEYSPHISLGYGKDKKEVELIIKYATDMNLDFDCTIDSIFYLN